MRNKKLIRGKIYRYPRKLKKEIKKRGECIIWFDLDEPTIRLLNEYATKNNLTQNQAIIKMLEEHLDRVKLERV
jgi:hypothetical protein